MRREDNKKGFTIVEVTISMAFLAVLIMSIASLIIKATEMYRKGLTLRAVNSVGAEIIEDVSRSALAGSDEDISSIDENKDGAISFEEQAKGLSGYFNANYGTTKTGERIQNYGVFCTGASSYIWNTARTLRDDYSSNPHVILDVPSTVNLPDNVITPKFLRVYDPGRILCREFTTWSSHPERLQLKKPDGQPMKKQEDFDRYVTSIMQDDEIDLALYEFNVLPISQSIITRQAYMSINFILGTKESVNIVSNSDYCRGSGNEETSDDNEFNHTGFEYCAVNKFNFAIRTGGNIDEKG